MQAGVWSTPLAAAVAPAGDSLTLTLAAPPASGTAIQIHLSGQGPRPVMAVDGGPLDGWWDEPLSGSGRGRDVSLVRVWTPGAA